ncbi:MAG: hypothetical protein MUC35_05280 [Candidatus Margulisbacteria bacterium]|jgi:hypothetical protein|nr:hypothetical protein [Candidatus Margulisiibacteriota bacterium]
MDIGKAFVDSWTIYIKNFIVILLAGIIAALLGWLIAPTIGLQFMFVKAKRGGAVVFNDVFAPFGKFFPLLGAALLICLLFGLSFVPAVVCFNYGWNLIGGLFMAAAVIGVVYYGVCWLFALMLIYDKGVPIVESLKASRALVVKNGWWQHFLLLIMVGIVTGLGNVLWGVGALLTMPLGTGAIASAYVDETK